MPDPTPIQVLPYLGPFTRVPLRPDDLLDCTISTDYPPGLSHLQENHFLPAPHGTSPAAHNVARIFDVLAIAADNPPLTFGHIPLSPEYLDSTQQHYWLPVVKIEAALAVLIERTRADNYESPEIQTAQAIANIISLKNVALGFPTLPIIITFMDPNQRGGTHPIFLHDVPPPVFRTRHRWPIHASRRCHVTSRNRCATTTHTSDRRLGVDRVPNLHTDTSHAEALCRRA